MESAQLEKLRKLLALSTSENEHEAMAALKQANKMLKDANKTWADILEAPLAAANNRYQQLHLHYVALANKYNELVRMVAAQQVAAVGMPQSRMQRRRSRRL